MKGSQTESVDRRRPCLLNPEISGFATCDTSYLTGKKNSYLYYVWMTSDPLTFYSSSPRLAVRTNPFPFTSIESLLMTYAFQGRSIGRTLTRLLCCYLWNDSHGKNGWLAKLSGKIIYPFWASVSYLWQGGILSTFEGFCDKEW